MEKKIGIITLDGIYNYGNRLQNLAVQKIWEKEGFSCETLVIKRSLLREARNYFNFFRKNFRKSVKFIRFNKKHLKIRYVFNKNATLPKRLEERFDYFCVGSDQVWNPNLRKKEKDVFYLKFTDTKKRVALSPSIAVTDVPEHLKDSFISGILGFDKISVRETQGAELIKRLTGLDATVLVDPTLALERSEWEELLNLGNVKREPYILLYFLGEVTDEFMKSAEAFAEKNNLKIISAHIKNGLGEKNDYDPEQFVDLIRGAEFVFTDSFHGTAFSLIFNKNFYAFPRWNSKNDGNVQIKSRLLSILEKTALPERLVDAFPQTPAPIDYIKINALLEAEREKVKTFVKTLDERVESPVSAYSCWSKNDLARAQSSSGGVYSLLAEYVISNSGVVAAAVYNENNEVEHVLCEALSELEKTRGSKYQPSRLHDTFSRIKSHLDTGRLVLFVGTPCQCEGLISYLGNKPDNLIVTDFICHGIPSRLAWREYQKSLSKSGFDLKRVNMRDKSTGWSRYSWLLVDKNGNERLEDHSDNPFMKGFIQDFYLRPSCYKCQFKELHRKTDLTLGDFWGVGRIQKEMFDDRGTSLVIAHTKKGEELLEKIKDSMVMKKAPLAEAVGANPCLVRSVSKTPGREEFFRRIRSGEDFITIVSSMTRKSFKKRLKKKLKRLLGR